MSNIEYAITAVKMMATSVVAMIARYFQSLFVNQTKNSKMPSAIKERHTSLCSSLSLSSAPSYVSVRYMPFLNCFSVSFICF